MDLDSVRNTCFRTWIANSQRSEIYSTALEKNAQAPFVLKEPTATGKTSVLALSKAV